MDKFNEAVVVLAKCGNSHKTYVLRVEKTGRDKWLVTWAFPIKDAAAQREGYDKTTVKGNIEFDCNYPGCPYCGGHQMTLCSCGHLNCTVLHNGAFTCEWCGTQGQIGDYTGEAITAGMDV